MDFYRKFLSSRTGVALVTIGAAVISSGAGHKLR